MSITLAAGPEVPSHRRRAWRESGPRVPSEVALQGSVWEREVEDGALGKVKPQWGPVRSFLCKKEACLCSLQNTRHNQAS